MKQAPEAIVMIPARFDSTRFPGKPLALIQGITMIERVFRIAKQSQLADEVYIATDNQTISDHAKSFGAKVLMTSPACPTGTDRVAEAASLVANDNTILISL